MFIVFLFILNEFTVSFFFFKKIYIHVFLLILTYCHVTCSTLVIKQKLPGIYVQPSYKSALSKKPLL